MPIGGGQRLNQTYGWGTEVSSQSVAARRCPCSHALRWPCPPASAPAVFLLTSFTVPYPCPATPHLDPRAVGRCLRLWHCTSSLPGLPFCLPSRSPLRPGCRVINKPQRVRGQHIRGCMCAALRPMPAHRRSGAASRDLGCPDPHLF